MSSKPYNARVVKACEYIAQHMDDELSLNVVSDVAAVSKFHFHRLFAAFTGVSVTRFVQLERFRRASYRLAFEPEKRVIDIALEAGFDSPEAFSRAFKRTFEQSPSEFRQAPRWPEWHQRLTTDYKPQGELPMDICVVTFEPTKVAKLTHKGDPKNVLATAGRFIQWRKQTGLSPIGSSRTFGIPHSDPNTTPAEDFRWDVCGEITEDVPANDFGVETAVIPGGRCAVVRHRGSHANMDDTIYHIYRDWLPKNNEEVRDFPCFFHYINFIHEVDECDLLTDIYIPLK